MFFPPNRPYCSPIDSVACGIHTLFSWRVAGKQLSPTVSPHPLPWSSSTWYNPFKRLHVIPVCAGSSLRAAAHSTFSSAGALTFPSALLSCIPSLLCLSFISLLSFVCSHPLFSFHAPSLSPLPSTHTLYVCVESLVTDVILYAVTGRYHLWAAERRTEEGTANFSMCQVNCDRGHTRG